MTETPRVLAMVAPELADDVERVAAASGYQMMRARPDHCRREWAEATAVLLDASTVEETLAAGLPRRSGLMVVGVTGDGPTMWRSALALGAGHGFVLPDDEHAVVRALSRIRRPTGPAGIAVAVIGGHGGAGASTLAAGIGLVACERGHGGLLLDLDELGGGQDLLLGVEDHSGLRWQELTLEGGQVVAESLHTALPHAAGGLAVLAGRRGAPAPVRPEAALAAIDAARGNGDVVVVDVPRRGDNVVSAVVEAVDLVVLVCGATIRACAAGREMASRLSTRAGRVEVVVRGPSPGGLRAGQVAHVLGLPLLAATRPDTRLTRDLESGGLMLARRSPLRRCAAAVLDRAEVLRGPVR
jgi:secretion/DNA translocation related CpaE-like protein